MQVKFLFLSLSHLRCSSTHSLKQVFFSLAGENESWILCRHAALDRTAESIKLSSKAYSLPMPDYKEIYLVNIENSSALVCYVVLTGEELPTFRKITVSLKCQSLFPRRQCNIQGGLNIQLDLSGNTNLCRTRLLFFSDHKVPGRT